MFSGLFGFKFLVAQKARDFAVEFLKFGKTESLSNSQLQE